MHILLDTHIYLWHVSDDELLSREAKSLILGADSIRVSAASLWEIAIKVKLGKLKADLERLVTEMEPSGFRELPVTSRHAAQLTKLPLLHPDPFDRLLVAQAMSEPLYLVTTDSQLPQYSSLAIQV